MKKLKFFFSVLLSVVIFSSVIVYADNITKMIQVTYRNISILVNDKQIQSDKEPFIYHGSVFAPIRTIGEAVDKNVQWDDKANQVKITDQKLASLSFPIHKIGERVYIHPYAITINKVHTGTKDSEGFDYHENMLFIDITVECFSKGEKNIQLSRPFTIWDKYGNKLDFMIRNGLQSLKFYPNDTITGYLYHTIDNTIKNKDLTLVFYPIDIEHIEPKDEINVFMAFDIGKIE